MEQGSLNSFYPDVVFWSSTNSTNNWNVTAGFDSGSMTVFDRLGTLGTAGTQIDAISTNLYSCTGCLNFSQ